MALSYFNRTDSGKVLGVRPGTLAAEKLTDEGGWTATTITPAPEYVGVPELGQFDIETKHDAIKEHQEIIVEELESLGGTGGGGG